MITTRSIPFLARESPLGDRVLRHQKDVSVPNVVVKQLGRRGNWNLASPKSLEVVQLCQVDPNYK